MAGPIRTRRNGTTVALLAAVVCGMVGLSFASVPLYRLFCQATGFGGTTQRAAAARDQVGGALITVRFDAQTAPDLGWEFRPLESAVRLHPGEQREVFFRATNRTAETVTGTATFNVTPTNEQQLKPGENRDMGVVFFVDPDLLTDPNTSDVRTITLSYTMFRAHQADRPNAAASPQSPTPQVN